MGKCKNIQIQTMELCDLPFKKQVEVWKDILNDMSEEDMNYYLNNLCGNLKTSFNIALEELDD